MWWFRFLFLLIGYAFGLIQTGYFHGKRKGIDLREHGSKNTGATNALRVMGVKDGLIVFFFDALKAFVPCLAVSLLFRDDPLRYVYFGYTAFGVILGNDFPFYLKFRGGKGVAATCGYGFAWHPFIALGGLALFFAIAFATGYVSLASILTAVSVIGVCVIFGLVVFGKEAFSNPVFLEFFALVVVMQTILILRHSSNIKRLLSGTENRFGKKKAKEGQIQKEKPAEISKEEE